jgi:hypothetical protein
MCIGNEGNTDMTERKITEYYVELENEHGLWTGYAADRAQLDRWIEHAVERDYDVTKICLPGFPNDPR